MLCGRKIYAVKVLLQFTNYNCIYTFLMSLVSKMKFHPFFTLHSENSSNIPNNCHAK